MPQILLLWVPAIILRIAILLLAGTTLDKPDRHVLCNNHSNSNCLACVCCAVQHAYKASLALFHASLLAVGVLSVEACSTVVKGAVQLRASGAAARAWASAGVAPVLTRSDSHMSDKLPVSTRSMALRDI
jgi:hypothetical protein